MCRFLRVASKFRRTTDGDLVDTLHNDNKGAQQGTRCTIVGALQATPVMQGIFGENSCSETSARRVNISGRQHAC